MFDKSTYDKNYNKSNVTRLFIGFNHNKPDDAEMLEWIRKKENYSQYIKDLIRQDMTAPQQLKF